VTLRSDVVHPSFREYTLGCRAMLNPRIEFFHKHPDMLRCVDTKSNLISANCNYGHRDIVANMNDLAKAPLGSTLVY
jgi:hypothetical protein